MPDANRPQADLVADLVLLTQALDDPSVHLDVTLSNLAAELATAYVSLLGFDILLDDENTCLISTLPADTPVRSSLLIPLNGTAPRHWLLLYASAERAFQAGAPELARLSGSAALSIDQHLSPATRPAVGRPIQAASQVHQAIGVLVGLGATPEQARAALHATAAASGRSEVSVAIDILNRVAD